MYSLLKNKKVVCAWAAKPAFEALKNAVKLMDFDRDHYDSMFNNEPVVSGEDDIFEIVISNEHDSGSEAEIDRLTKLMIAAMEHENSFTASRTLAYFNACVDAIDKKAKRMEVKDG